MAGAHAEQNGPKRLGRAHGGRWAAAFGNEIVVFGGRGVKNRFGLMEPVEEPVESVPRVPEDGHAPSWAAVHAVPHAGGGRAVVPACTAHGKRTWRA